jgi:acetyltransferase-like isoleucine patch superfamily enzyme
MPAIHSTAVVEADSIGEGVLVGEFAVVRAGVVLGDGAKIHPNVVIEANVEIGPGTEVLPGTYLGREPRANRTIARQPTFGQVLRIGANCSIGAAAVVYRDVEVGPECLIADGAKIREMCRIGARTVIGADVSLDRDVIVGEGVRVMTKAHLTGHVRVHDNAFIGPLTGTTNDNAFGRDGYREEGVRGPTIEEGAMIGGGVSLLPGIVVGRGAMVSAGAVVTRDVEPGATVLGVPARPI